MITGFEIALIVVMQLFNGIFAAYEMALASVSMARLQVLAGRGLRGSADALFMKSRMEASFAVVQLGITLLGALAAAIGGISVSDRLAPFLIDRWGMPSVAAGIVSLLAMVIPFSAFTIIFAELVPKMIALNHRERVCLQLSPFMKGLFHVTWPVVRLLEKIVKWLIVRMGRRPGALSSEDDPGLHELQAATALARTARLIGAHQEKILLSAAALSTRPVKEIAIPLEGVSMISIKSTLSQALIRAHMDMHTRFPVLERENDLQSVSGYVNFKDIIVALRINPQDPSIRGILRPIKAVSGDLSISHALELMIKEKLHIMLVTGKNDRFTAMVALEDIIEELVGEIEDEFDRLSSHLHAVPGGWIAGGGVMMAVIAEQPGVGYTGNGEGRLAEWCERHGLDESRGGEPVEIDGLRVTARKFRRKKVSEAFITPSVPVPVPVC
jgi:putative hemolysin